MSFLHQSKIKTINLKDQHKTHSNTKIIRLCAGQKLRETILGIIKYE